MEKIKLVLGILGWETLVNDGIIVVLKGFKDLVETFIPKIR